MWQNEETFEQKQPECKMEVDASDKRERASQQGQGNSSENQSAKYFAKRGSERGTDCKHVIEKSERNEVKIFHSV